MFDLMTLLDPGVESQEPTVKVSTLAIGLALYSPPRADFGVGQAPGFPQTQPKSLP